MFGKFSMRASIRIGRSRGFSLMHNLSLQSIPAKIWFQVVWFVQPVVDRLISGLDRDKKTETSK